MATKASEDAIRLGGTALNDLESTSKSAMGGFKLESEVTKAAGILASFLANPEHPESALNAIPKAVLQSAQGFAIFTVLKAGFVWSGKAGSGVVIARLPDGSWSAPSLIATGAYILRFSD